MNDEMTSYNHAFFSGFYAEKYDTEGENLFNEVSERAIKSELLVFLKLQYFHLYLNHIAKTEYRFLLFFQ